MGPFIKVSIVIPVYNASKYLDRCIDSLLAQTLDSVEFIFVDDCSQDQSVAIIRNRLSDFEQAGFSVKVLQHAVNRGSSAARNTGLKEVTGEYTGWVDADDYISSNMMKALYDMISKDRADMVCCDFEMVYPDGRVVKRPQPQPTSADAFIKMLMIGTIQGMLWNKLFKSSIVKANDIQFVEGSNLGEDRNVLIKVLCFCQKIIYKSESLYFYMQENVDSITRDVKMSRVYEEIRNTEDVMEFMKAKGVSYDLDSALKLKFRSKSKLLNSLDINDFKNWSNTFSESNALIETSHLGTRHKILAQFAKAQTWLPIKLWISLKRASN